MSGTSRDGVLPVLKPVGPTSHDIVARARRWFPGRAVGHLGTLDPAAGGLLLLAVGAATRAARFLDPPGTVKTYRAWAWLGIETDSDDAEGRVTRRPGARGFGSERVAAAVAARVGPQEQVPPARSAVRVAGRHAYERARRGETPALEPRPVVVAAARLLALRPAAAADLLEALFEVSLSRGGYVRAWVRDLGRDLGCGAAVRVLVRGRIGTFAADDALTAAEAEGLAATGGLDARLVAVDTLLAGWPALTLPPDPHGRRLGRGREAPFGVEGWVRVRAGADAPTWALAEVREGRWREVVRLMAEAAGR